MQSAIFKGRGGVPEYTVARRARVTRRLHLELDEHGGLVVVAPVGWSARRIGAALAQHAARVARFVARARARRRPPVRYVAGEKHPYLGEFYPLALHRGGPGMARVALVGGEIQVVAPAALPGAVQARLRDWYQERAIMVLGERLQRVAASAPWTHGRPLPLRLRRMKRSWGNCSSAGAIKLNTHLVKAPVELIDSVIAHELCHLLEMNHGRAFYRLLEKLDPDWRRHRAQLRDQGFLYLPPAAVIDGIISGTRCS